MLIGWDSGHSTVSAKTLLTRIPGCPNIPRGRGHRAALPCQPTQSREIKSAAWEAEPPMNPLRDLLSVVLVCLASTVGLTQESPSSEKQPKLGLVLEGGGALGLAHIGVIQYLEERRIPVRYIAGTSMGGLVGGVYATGRNATELRDVVKGIKWDEVINGQSAYDDLSFRRKQDAREYPSTLEFGLHQGLQFPAGFNSGQQVELILDRIALPYSGISSFDELPIPFACVATDLVTRSEHVFRSGPLDVALRSTMSLPGIFTPVRYEGHVYVDGGLLNNFPVR